MLSTGPREAQSYPFLSPEWIEAARRIRNDYRGKTSPPPVVRKKLLVDMDVQTAMQAFTRGEIKVEGDIAKLMTLQTLQTVQVDPIALEAATRIRAITH